MITVDQLIKDIRKFCKEDPTVTKEEDTTIITSHHFVFSCHNPLEKVDFTYRSEDDYRNVDLTLHGELHSRDQLIYILQSSFMFDVRRRMDIIVEDFYFDYEELTPITNILKRLGVDYTYGDNCVIIDDIKYRLSFENDDYSSITIQYNEPKGHYHKEIIDIKDLEDYAAKHFRPNAASALYNDIEALLERRMLDRTISSWENRFTDTSMVVKFEMTCGWVCYIEYVESDIIFYGTKSGLSVERKITNVEENRDYFLSTPFLKKLEAFDA